MSGQARVVALWSTKGGAGTSVSAALMAAGAAAAGNVLLVDLAGDQQGLFTNSSPEAKVPALRAHTGGAADEAEVEQAVQQLRNFDGTVVVDAGRINPEPPDRGTADMVRCQFARLADSSLLVTRACGITLRRVFDAPVEPTGVIMVNDHRRLFDQTTIEELVGPVAAVVPYEHGVGLAADAGNIAGAVWSETAERLAAVATHPDSRTRPRGYGLYGDGGDKRWCSWWVPTDRHRFMDAAGWALTLRHGPNLIQENTGKAAMADSGAVADLRKAAEACRRIDPSQWRQHLYENLHWLVHMVRESPAPERSDVAGMEL